jgi:SAM-dependent methyltransferase
VLGLQAGETVLELGAGTGETGLEAAAILGEGDRLISSDCSPEMLEVARRRGTELGRSSVDYRVIDAKRIELVSNGLGGQWMGNTRPGNSPQTCIGSEREMGGLEHKAGTAANSRKRSDDLVRRGPRFESGRRLQGVKALLRESG